MIQFQEHTHYSSELEKVIIGTILLEKLAFSRIVKFINKPEIFYYESNRIVYSAIMEMYKQSIPIDILTVNDFMVNRKRITVIDGTNVPYYLAVCMRNVVSSSNLEYHSYILNEMFKRRRVIEIKYAPLDDYGLDPISDIQSINSALSKLTETSSKKDWYDMSELIIELYKHQEEMKITGGVGIFSGVKAIDDANGGFFNGNMIFVGARPSVGKSALANTMAINMARNGSKVGIISLEMSNVEIAARLSSIDIDLDYSKIYRGLLHDEHERQSMYERISNSTVVLPISVSDKTDVDMFEIRGKAERLKASTGLDVLMIDYLQLIGTDEVKNSNRENLIAKISRGCKILAKDLNIPVIVLGQLNRQVTQRKTGDDRYPVLSDIRESGAIEQDSDIVLFLHSDFMSGHLLDEQGNSTEGQADLVVRKWRSGKNNFIIPMDFIGRKMQFVERNNGIWNNVQPSASVINQWQGDAPF